MIKELYSDIDCCTAAGNIDFQRLTFKEKIIITPATKYR